MITVCLNPGEALERTARSILGQRAATLEWIVKDGLSTDGTAAGNWPDARVKFVSQKDTGIFDAMNQALEHCTQDYILYLNAGDVFCAPDVLQRIAGCLGEATPDVFYTFYEYASPGNVFKYPSQLRPRFLYRRSVCHQATFVRRDCYAKHGGFNPAFRVVADDELLARLILKHHVTHLLVPLPAVRVEEWNFTNQPGNGEQVERVRGYIRNEYLTPGQRWRARMLYACTLPSLRAWWLAAPRNSRRYRLYVTLSNLVNQRV